MLMRRRLMVFILFAMGLYVIPAAAGPFTISFTAEKVKTIMRDDYGDPLSDANYLWGLWAIRAMPIVSSGGYEILSGAVDDQVTGDFWVYKEPNDGVVWANPYGTEVAYFHLKMASEHLDTDAHPLYFIADQPATEFQSYAFNNTVENPIGGYPYRRSQYVGVCGGIDTITGGDVAPDDPRCNQTNVLPDNALFSFTFNLLDPEASVLGWQFLVDGSKYSRDSIPKSLETLWIMDFQGGDIWLPYEPFRQSEAGGGLNNNVGSGYQVLFAVPEPGTLILVGLGFAALAIARRHL